MTPVLKWGKVAWSRHGTAVGPLLGALLVALLALHIVQQSTPGEYARPDSATYVDAARHLAAGDGFVSGRLFNPESVKASPVSTFAPGFSVLIALAMPFTGDAIAAAQAVVNACVLAQALLAYALAVWLTGRKLWPLCAAAASLLLLLPSAIAESDSLLSTLPFAVTVLLAVWAAIACAEDPSDRRTALWAGVSCAAVILTRWAGLWFVAGILAAIALVTLARSGFRLALRSLLWPGVALAALVLPWWARNLLSTGKLMGTRTLERSDPWRHLHDAWPQFSAFHTDAQSANVGWASTTVSVLLIGFGIWLLALWWPARLHEKPRVMVPLIAALSYFALMVASATLHHFDPLTSTRFWVPTWPLLLLVPLAALGESATLRRYWVFAGAGLFATSVLLCGWLYQQQLNKSLALANRSLGYLHGRWPEAAKVLAKQEGCVKVADDARPFLFHRYFDRIYVLPSKSAKMKPLLDREPNLCVSMFSSGVPDRRKRQNKRRKIVSDLESNHGFQVVYDKRNLTIWRSPLRGKSGSR